MGSDGCAREAFRFFSTDDLAIQGYLRPAVGAPRGKVLLLHGCTEHSGRYAEVADLLAGMGFAVVQFDLRGHGDSTGPRLLVRSFGEHAGDAVACLQHKRDALPDGPLFLCGVSMGGTIATLLVLEQKVRADGLVLFSPLLKLGREFSKLKIFLTKLIGPLAPRIPVARLDPKKFSHVEEAVRQYVEDEKVDHGWIPIGLGMATIDAIRTVEKNEGSLDVPLLVMHGTADAITDPEGSKRLVRNAASTDKTLKLYRGLYHDLAHESKKEEVHADLASWLRAHAPSPTLRPPKQATRKVV